jgi:hypothetical protein
MKPKHQGAGLQMKSFTDNEGVNYVFYKTPNGSYHAFREVQAREAIANCLGVDDTTEIKKLNRPMDH